MHSINCALNELQREIKNKNDYLDDWYYGPFSLLLNSLNKKKSNCFKEKYNQLIRENKKLSNKRDKIFKEINQILNKSKIVAIYFKGIVLEKILYIGENYRPIGDLDIYIPHDKFNTTIELLYKNEYKLLNPIGEKDKHHIVLIKNDVKVEIHKRLFYPEINIDETYILSHLQLINIMDKNILTFDYSAMFLHLIYHLYMDTYLATNNAFYVFCEQPQPKAKRFLYRAFELALFIEKYYEFINWSDIVLIVQKQELSYCFKNMIIDIIRIFKEVPHIYKLFSIIKDKEYSFNSDYLLKEMTTYLSNKNNSLSKYIEEKWKAKTKIMLDDHVIQIKMSGDTDNIINSTNTYVLDGITPKSEEEFSCNMKISTDMNSLLLEFDVSDEKLVFQDERLPINTCYCDCIGLFLVNTKKYIYRSIFILPYYKDDNISVMVYDTINQIRLDLFDVNILKRSGGYIIKINIPFFEFNYQIGNGFYFDVHISNCIKQNQYKKTTLSLSGKRKYWYDPCEFIKVII